METQNNAVVNWIFGAINLLFGGLITSLHLSKFQETRAREKEQAKNDAFLKEFREQNEQDHRDLWAQKADNEILRIIREDMRAIRASLDQIEKQSHRHRTEDR